MNMAALSENEIIMTMTAIALLLLFAFLMGTLMEQIKAPRVVGEITGGILLGSTFLYRLCPNQIGSIFMAYDMEGKVLNIFYQLGLIFLMLLSGYNTKLEMDRKNTKTIACVFAGATILPMLGAIPFIGAFQAAFIGNAGNEISFGLVFTIGVAITSIPVISKIFFDMGIMNTHFSNIVLTVSTIQDLCLWILLNAATRIAETGEVRIPDLLVVVGVTVGLFAVAKLVSDNMQARNIKMGAVTFYTVSCVLLLFVCAGLYKVGINIMYAAFLVGYLVKSFVGDAEGSDAKIRMEALGDFSFSFFVPVYFALVGIQLDLIHDFSVFKFSVFFILAFGLEAVGTLILLQFTDLNQKTKLNFAITMNARGGPGIVLATVAYSYGIINVEFFTVLILTTMLSSLIAGYWLRKQQRIDKNIFMNLTE